MSTQRDRAAQENWNAALWDRIALVCSAARAAEACHSAVGKPSEAQIAALSKAVAAESRSDPVAAVTLVMTMRRWLESAQVFSTGTLQNIKHGQVVKKLEAVEEAMGKLVVWAGGAENGESWKHGLDNSTGAQAWASLQRAYAEHLAKLNSAEFLARKRTLKRNVAAYEKACQKSSAGPDSELTTNATNAMKLASATLAEALLMDYVEAGDVSGIREVMEKMVEDIRANRRCAEARRDVPCFAPVCVFLAPLGNVRSFDRGTASRCRRQLLMVIYKT